MSLVLSFRLKVPGTDEFRGLDVISISYRFEGRLWLEGELLVIEWRGRANVQEVGTLNVRDDQLSLPAERLAVPASELARAVLEGGWWRPRLLVEARKMGALSIVPSEDLGRVRFWYARRDRDVAAEVVASLERAIRSASGPTQDRAAPAADAASLDTPSGGGSAG